MTIEDFAKLVNTMRQAQKEFFRTRSDSAFNEAKSLEHKVDKEVAKLLESRQKELFD